MPQLPIKVKVERAIAKYGDSFITTEKNGKSIFCTVCKFDIKFTNGHAGFCIKSHVNSRSHRRKVRETTQEQGVENVQPEVSPSSQCCSCCWDPSHTSDHSLDLLGCSTCGQMSNMSDFSPSQDSAPTQAILPGQVRPLSEHDREMKELQMEKLKLEIKERKLNLTIQEREGEERIKLFQKLNSCDFGQLITALISRRSVTGSAAGDAVDQDSQADALISRGSVTGSAAGDAVDHDSQAEDQGEEESIQC